MNDIVYNLVYKNVKENKVYNKYFNDEAEAVYYVNTDLAELGKTTTIRNIALTKFVYDEDGKLLPDQIKRIIELQSI